MSHISLAGFDMISLLGEGGMAAVWKARQVSLDRIVAIKILSSRFASDAADIQRFQQEAQSAAKLKHPGIVQVYDANIENGVYFFVMEFVDGYTCADWLARKGVLAEKDVLLIAECVADALGYAWERERIVHCDIKPDNVMVDEDGSVKVTDLGLSRTIRGMSVQEESDEILGTPAYMAPEQAMGDPGLDCRTDMYSLGAAMYHLATGRLLFESAPEQDVMNCQVNEQVANPRDLNPSLSKGICSLIEVLLAKEQCNRPADWGKVKEDILRVKKGLMPRVRLPDGAVSTILKCDKDMHPAVPVNRKRLLSELTEESSRRRSPVPVILLAVAALAAVFLCLKFTTGRNRTLPATVKAREQAVQAAPVPEKPSAAPVQPAEDRGQSSFNAAVKWEREHPGDFDSAINMFNKVKSEAPGSPLVDQAGNEIQRLMRLKMDRGKETVMKTLSRQAEALVKAGSYLKAAELYDGYKGEYASDTLSARQTMAAELRLRHLKSDEARIKPTSDGNSADSEQQRASDAAYAGVIKEAAALALKGDFSGAEACILKLLKQGVDAASRQSLEPVGSIMAEASAMERKILRSFEAQKGARILVQFPAGPKSLQVTGVTDQMVLALQVLNVGGASASVSCNFSVSDLALSEKLKRMGDDSDPAVAIVKGVMAYQSGSHLYAKRYFECLPASLSAEMTAALERGAAQQPDAAGNPGQGEAEGNGGKAAVPEPQRPQVTLPPRLAGIEGDIDRVIDLLLEDNPEMRSTMVNIARDSKGSVRGIEIRCESVRDISALAAMRDLKSLSIMGGWEYQAPLDDIEAVRAMSLDSLTVESCRLKSLNALKGLPLKALSVRRCDVRDISPLKGMPIEALDLSQTQVFDFSVCSQMNLIRFSANGGQLKDLSFLKNSTRLNYLSISDTKVHDFSLIAQMPLRGLWLEGTQFKSLDVLRKAQLDTLNLSRTSVSDLQGLKKFSNTLKHLYLNDVKVRDFTFLKALDLQSLSLQGTAFDDISLLSEMKLSNLNIAGTRVSSLNGLNASGLVDLNIESSKVSSITELRRASELRRLNTRGSQIRNFMPLHGLGIEHITLDEPMRMRELFRKLPDLRSVNGRPLEKLF